MKISSSFVSMDSSREAEEQSMRRIRLSQRVEGGRVEEMPEENATPLQDRVSLSSAKDVPSRAIWDASEKMRELSEGSGINEIDTDLSDPELETLKKMLEILTGRKIDITSHDRSSQGSPSPNARPKTFGRREMGLVLEESHYESETTRFHAAGRVTTEDGRRMNFDLGLTMEREYHAEQTLVVSSPRALVDPLVINFSGKPAALSDRRFSFDLNGDGTKEEVPLLQEGSGFLALDKNGNGTIDDGTELFGAVTGSGFGELAELDGDGNGWLDENDELFGRLLIWSKDEGGGGSLSRLAGKEIGAIYLESAETLFDHKDSENGDLGRTARTGIYLEEGGGVGTIQHIDLAV